MVPDWETNHLFVSDRLEIKFPAVLADLRSALRAIDIIPGTSDFWCRDYMPIQLDEHRFCQFVYAPNYLRGWEQSITPPEKCRLPFMQELRQEQIVLDGGNVVSSRTKVILTDKVYNENRTIKRPQLRKRLEQVFQAECIFIPKQAGDDVGHSDGVVRFVSENRVLINDYSAIDPSYGTKLRTLLEKKGLEVETLPMFEEQFDQRYDVLPAVGIYINYLRVGDVVIVPGYDRSEDELAVERVRQIMPGSTVIQLPCRDLAMKGGVLNCISWTIKDGTGPAKQSEA